MWCVGCTCVRESVCIESVAKLKEGGVVEYRATFLHSACVVALGDGNGEGIEEVGAIMGVRMDVDLRVGWVCLFG